MTSVQQSLRHANKILRDTERTVQKIKRMNTKRILDLGKIHGELYRSFTHAIDLQQKKRITRAMNIVRKDREQLLKQNRTLK
jgi:hypothetical protein